MTRRGWRRVYVAAWVLVLLNFAWGWVADPGTAAVATALAAVTVVPLHLWLRRRRSTP